MAKIITLPKIGVNMTEAVITKWLVKPGQHIKDGDPIIEAETDKSTQEIQATESGIVAKVLVSEGDTVKCNQEILVLVDEGEIYDEKTDLAPIQTQIPITEKDEPIRDNQVTEHVSITTAKSNERSNRIKISPLAKKMAILNLIDYTKIKPSLPGGRIVKKDILGYLSDNTIQPVLDNEKKIPLNSIRKTIASRLAKSHLEKPSASLTVSVNAEALIALRKKYIEFGTKISVDAFLAKVVAKALELHPAINSSLEDDQIIQKNKINIGIAVDTQKGLMVPVIKHANKKSLVQISEEIKKLAENVKQGEALAESLRGGTFTITNLGVFGVEEFTPIINPPECCILAIGAIRKIFVPDNHNNPILLNTMRLTLVFDHRIIDGAPAARFLREIKYFIEVPEMLI